MQRSRLLPPVSVGIVYLLMTFSCRQTESSELPEANSEQGRDTSSPDRKAQYLFDTPIVNPGKLSLLSVNSYDTIIRLTGSGGWGEFEYICSIYGDMEKSLQLVRQRGGRGSDKGYSIHERALKPNEYDSLLVLVNRYGIYNVRQDLAQDGYALDADTYAILIKQGFFKKAVHWHHEASDPSPEKIRAQTFVKTILHQAEYPLPEVKVRVDKKTRDSLECYLSFSDPSVVMDFRGRYRHDSLSFDLYGTRLKIARRWESSLDEDLTVEGQLPDGKWVELDKVMVE